MRSRLQRCVCALGCAISVIASHGSVVAQHSPLLSYSSNSGFLQATLGARLYATIYAPQSSPAWLIADAKTFLAPEVSLFGEAFAGSRMYGLIELRADRGEVPTAGALQTRIEQLFVRATLSRTFALQAGKFITPFGAYPQRHRTASDAFIRGPLPYEWRTVMRPAFVPDNSNVFLGWKDQPALFRPTGVPPVWGVPYQVGALAFGSLRKLDYRAAVLNSAASSVPEEWNSIEDVWRRPSLAGGLSYAWSPALRTGASVARGPFLRDVIEKGSLPTDSRLNDFDQTIYGVDATYARGLIELRGEALLDRWHVPNVTGTPTDYSYYVEARAKLSPGLFVAVRGARMTFNHIAQSVDSTHAALAALPWDHAVSRMQLAGGYQINQLVSVRGEYQWTLERASQKVRNNLLSLQLRIEP